MLSWLFGERAEPVVIDLEEVYDHLDLRHERYRESSRIHRHIQCCFGQMSLRGGDHYGTGHVYYADENRELVIKAPAKQFSDEPEPEDIRIKSSACIGYTEIQRGFGKKAFGLIIRQEASDLESYEDSLIFGLYGIVDRNGKLTVKKLMTPGTDEAHRMTPTKEIAITPGNVQGALHYAHMCIEDILSGQHFYPRQCLEQAIRGDENYEAVRILRQP